MPRDLRDLEQASAPSGPGSVRAWIQVFHEVTDVLGAARSLKDAAPGLLRAVGQGSGWSFGAVWAHDAARHTLGCLGSWTGEGARFPGSEAATLPGATAAPGSLARRVLDLRWPVWIEDLRAEKSLPHTAPVAVADGLRTVLGIPCLYGDLLEGVVELARPDTLPKDDVQLAAALALGRQIGQFVARESAVRGLVRSKRDLGDLFENAPVGVSMIDRDGRVVRANRAMLELLGHSRDEVVGRPWRELHMDPAVADEALARLASGAAASSDPASSDPASSDPASRRVDLDARLRRKDGSERWVRIHANALWDEGVLSHVRAFTIDLTAVQRAERALRESEEGHRRLVEGAHDYALHELDEEGRVTAWNSGARRLYGYEAADVVGKDFAASFTAEDRADEVPARMLRLAIDEGKFQHEGWRVRKDGSRFPAEVVYTALREPTGRLTGVSQLTRDISDRMRMRALRARSADLELANRDVIRSATRSADIQRVIAATLEVPLDAVERAIEGASRAAGVGTVPPAFGALARRIDELRRAIGGLGELAAAPSPDPGAAAQPLDLLRLATDTLDMLRETAAQRRVRVEVEVEPALTDVVVDPTRLRLLIYNLLSNAIKFSRERGRVGLRLLAEGADSFRLEVEDSGIGMSDEEIARVLRAPDEPGAEAGGTGSGVGLRASRQVVEQQGGRLGAQSTPGRGSVFFAVLPRAPGAVRADAASEAPAAARELHALVVADDVATRAGLAWTLGAAGCEVVASSDPQDGLDLAQERRYEVLAVDLGLEEDGALDFLAAVRAEGASRDAPWVVVAVGTGEGGVAGLLVSDLLTRPAPADRLFAALERAGVPRGRKSTILVVDGDPEVLKSATRTLDMLNYRALAEADAHAALRRALEERPAALLVAPLTLRGLDPFAFLEHLRQVPGLEGVPVLLTVPRHVDEAQAAELGEAAGNAAREGRWLQGLSDAPGGPSSR